MVCWPRSKIDQAAIALTAINSEDQISMANEEHSRAERGSATSFTRKERWSRAYQDEEREVMRPGVCSILSSNEFLAYSVSTPTHLEVAFRSSSVSSSISWVAQSSHEDAASLSAKE